MTAPLDLEALERLLADRDPSFSDSDHIHEGWQISFGELRALLAAAREAEGLRARVADLVKVVHASHLELSNYGQGKWEPCVCDACAEYRKVPRAAPPSAAATGEAGRG